MSAPGVVYVPLVPEQLHRLRRSGSLGGPLPAHSATPGLRQAHDLSPDDEAAEYTALAYAGVSALMTPSQGPRLVLAADAAVVVGEDGSDGRESADPSDPFGRVVLAGLTWSQVSSVFADEPESAQRLARARSLADGLSFDQVVDAGDIEDLLDASDLLWFAPSELDRLLGPGT